MRIVLELIRIMAIFLFLGSILSQLIKFIFVSIGLHTDQYDWLCMIAIYMSLFVLYRDKLQFSSWYNKGKEREKLPIHISQLILATAILLIVLTPVFSLLM
ncbi:hypothetical protein [Peribacillus loiseleuriae]|uniref:Uncharacterized protein n=1 Tax=Peribacillus loiseleuriae TaxID=1679170 RepID=A0A0K9GXJ4_9BACI|nr:hypothetical protein [Peribacillus loiseleuriae]KMY51336.1 hypothetical protein AC625_18770 [Peribacillus loiseleuriae]